MLATKLKGKVTASRKLIIDIPAEVAPGAVEVILLQDTAHQPAKTGSQRSKHPAFGIWADRDDIASSINFAAQLRKSIESRQD